jgi:hypothetical protein
MSHGHDVGDTIRLGVTFRGEDGLPTDPTTVTLTLRAPDGTQATPAPTTSGQGVYEHDWSPTQGGNWTVHWQGTGAVAEVEWERYYVRPRPVATP